MVMHINQLVIVNLPVNTAQSDVSGHQDCNENGNQDAGERSGSFDCDLLLTNIKQEIDPSFPNYFDSDGIESIECIFLAAIGLENVGLLSDEKVYSLGTPWRAIVLEQRGRDVLYRLVSLLSHTSRIGMIF